MHYISLSFVLILVLVTTFSHAQEGAYADPTQDQFALYEAGAEAFASEDWIAAIDYFNASLQIGDMNITYLNLGRALFKAGRCQEAKEAYDKVSQAPQVRDPAPVQVIAKLREYREELKSCEGYAGAAIPVPVPVEPEPEPFVGDESLASPDIMSPAEPADESDEGTETHDEEDSLNWEGADESDEGAETHDEEDSLNWEGADESDEGAETHDEEDSLNWERADTTEGGEMYRPYTLSGGLTLTFSAVATVAGIVLMNDPRITSGGRNVGVLLTALGGGGILSGLVLFTIRKPAAERANEEERSYEPFADAPRAWGVIFSESW